jgi:hypothetical protein
MEEAVTNPLDKEKIVRELAAIVGQSAQSQAKTILCNIVFVFPERLQSTVSKTIDYLLGKRPARVIYIIADNNGRTDVRISARCSLAGSLKSVCFEEIFIKNGADNLGIDSRSWVPLMLDDIPSFLVWLDTLCPVPDAILQAQEYFDKLIIDTELSGSSGKSLLEIYNSLFCMPKLAVDDECRDDDEKSIILSDFAWEKGKDLRLVTAKSFDPAGNRKYLDSLRRIETASQSHGFNLLYFSWLACRLGWTHGKLKKNILYFNDKAGRIVECESSIRRDNGVRVGINADNGFTLSIEAHEKDCRIVFPADGTDQAIHCSIPDTGSLLLKETDTIYPDRLFIDTVRYAAAIESE